MKKEFLVERQGKQFCLYAGLLDLAHTNGLKSIVTKIHQIPTNENGNNAVVSATATFEDGREFTGIGDAAPNNVAKPMANCVLRFAETRAKARALRDATNIGVAAFEELGDDSSETDSGARTIQPPTQEQRDAQELLALKKEFQSVASSMGHEWPNTENGKEDRRNFVALLTGKKISSLSELTLTDWRIAVDNLSQQSQAKAGAA